MKRARILMLGLGLAILAGAAAAEPAVAQCFWCTSGPGPADGSEPECNFCVRNAPWGLDDYCTTPVCDHCEVGGQRCLGGVVMLDGRLRPDDADGEETSRHPHQTVARTVLAVHRLDSDVPYAEIARDDMVRASTTRRRCDGGIIARQYSAAEIQAIRQGTIYLTSRAAMLQTCRRPLGLDRPPPCRPRRPCETGRPRAAGRWACRGS